MRVWLDGGVNDGIGGQLPQPRSRHTLWCETRRELPTPAAKIYVRRSVPSRAALDRRGTDVIKRRDQAADRVQPAAPPHHSAPQRLAWRRGPSPTRRLELRPQTPPNRDAESMSWAVHRCSRCARQRKQAVRAKSSQNRQKTVGLRVYAFCGACGAGGGGGNAHLRIKTALASLKREICL